MQFDMWYIGIVENNPQPSPGPSVNSWRLLVYGAVSRIEKADAGVRGGVLWNSQTFTRRRHGKNAGKAI